ncbi:hypothetical protein [Fibrella forsythiae]|uniref:Uncharacterized protein n=1 Tax=Fibrella forsythiae TaxID=2817061 RepID=A0ABS3JB41_9BACT|nr:hypothetical protein [Fibrella forsythiae]MBO0947205.1 hypothetical protein [Fibrella forsythiae]
MRRSTVAILGFLTFFCLFKWARLYTLNYSFNDMYAFLQMAVSWMDGRPFMYDNIWSYHHRIHNYYTVFLWAPFIRLGGAYGLFASQVLLLMLAFGLVNERLSRQLLPSMPAWVRYGFVASVLLGPISLWLNDHPNIGWHTELSYLPFSLLFALALTSNSRIWPWVTGALVVLVKEDGAILASLIYVAWFGLNSLRATTDNSLWPLIRRRTFWLSVGGWALVFVIGMVWLSIKNEAGEPRLKNTLAILSQSGATTSFVRQMAVLVGQSLALLLGVVFFLYLVLRNAPKTYRASVWLLFGLGVGTLTALNVVQSSFYFGQDAFQTVALTWPPRFVLVWSFATSFCALLLLAKAPGSRPNWWHPTTAITLAFVAGLFLVQVPIVYLVRSDLPTLADLKNLVRRRPAADKQVALLQPADIATIRRLAQLLPPHSNVLAFDYVVPIFHAHYGIWPTGNQFRPADVAVLPTNDFQGLSKTSAMPRQYKAFPLANYVIYATPPYEQYVLKALSTN